MNESQHLVATLKRLLKAQGYTYRRIGEAIGLSEPSVKRLFAGSNFTLARLVQLCELLNLTLAELMAQAQQDEPQIHHLSTAQEQELIADPSLLLVAVCVLNQWTAAEIVSTYQLSQTQCLQRLLRLDRLGMINLLPGDRVRLNIARDFEWLPNGPIQHFFRQQEKDDFLASRFDGEGESLLFLHGMLSPAAHARLQSQIRKLREEFAELHRESLATPRAQRSGTCLLLAVREWEPQSFTALRR